MFSRAVGREEHCKQISLVSVGSARSVWATLGLSLLTACVFSGSTLLRLQVALQGNCQKQALGCVHFPGLSCSGSGSWVPPQRHRLGWASILCPSQVRAAQVIRCLVNAIAATYCLHAARLSRYTTGAPSQADVDRPDPQEVLVSKEACLQFCR